MSEERKPAIGVLTSGGDCPGLNAVIRGVVKCAERLGYDTVGFEDGFEGLVDPIRARELTSENTAGILVQGGTILGATNKGRFGAITGENTRVNLEPRLLLGVQDTCAQYNLKGLVCIGGDGSMAVAQQFHEVGIPVVGVPKTIDNDLSSTAFTFGFDSAVACATEAIDRLHTTAASHGRIMILEVMGRHAGWIALHAGIAGGADVILLPEIPWSYESVCAQIRNRRAAGRKFSIVVVAEGAQLPCGESITLERRAEDRQVRLGGIGATLSVELQARLPLETRNTTLGHLQRGGQPTSFDRFLATQFGVHAVKLVHQGQFGRMVSYQPPGVTSCSIDDAIGQLKKVETDSAAVETARGLGISFGDTDNCGKLFAEPAEEVTLMGSEFAPAVGAKPAPLPPPLPAVSPGDIGSPAVS
ncbi:MAG: ATP-dependent 6-phosphofructokinase [Aureliella sp.]